MDRPAWQKPGLVIGVGIGLLVVGIGALVWFKSRTNPDGQQPAVLVGGFGPLEDAKRSRAQLGCMTLKQATMAYALSPANANNDFPTQLTDLLQPPFGGASFLQNGREDLNDPWGRPYQLEQTLRDDGSVDVLIFTTAPDGTPISQYGVGASARPKP